MRTINEWKMSGLSAREMAQEALKRLEEKEALNCAAEIAPDLMAQAGAMDERADRKTLLLAGIPVLIKDNIDVSGMHTTAGSLALSDNLAETDAPVVANLRRNGAVILGKSNMTEFANYTTDNMPNGYSSRGGQVIHAADPALNPGGSSSGSGVAVAAGIVPAAVGTDTNYSVIGCAMMNGICGIKPPVGVLSGQGIIPIARTLDSAGPMANHMRDALTLYSAMRDTPLEPVEPAKKLRIAVNTFQNEKLEEGQREFLDALIQRLRQGGAEVDEINQPKTTLRGQIMSWEFRPHLEEYLRASRASRKTLAEIIACYEAHPDTMMKYDITVLKESMDEAYGDLNSAGYAEQMQKRAELIASVRTEIAPYDAVLITGFTDVMHCCGLPSVTIPGKSEVAPGCKRCAILYGAEEMRLYAAALAIEEMA